MTLLSQLAISSLLSTSVHLWLHLRHMQTSCLYTCDLWTSLNKIHPLGYQNTDYMAHPCSTRDDNVSSSTNRTQSCINYTHVIEESQKIQSAQFVFLARLIDWVIIPDVPRKTTTTTTTTGVDTVLPVSKRKGYG